MSGKASLQFKDFTQHNSIIACMARARNVSWSKYLGYIRYKPLSKWFLGQNIPSRDTETVQNRPSVFEFGIQRESIELDLYNNK